MQTTSQNSVAERIINNIWTLMNQFRGNLSISEIFTPTLVVLYTFHKGYNVKTCTPGCVEFMPNGDMLYNDLINLIPYDRHIHHMMFRLIMEHPFIDSNELNSVYVDILRGLFDLVASNSSKVTGDFYTPVEVTKLMAYIVNKSECKSVFDPFCGTASIIHELSHSKGLPKFYGQELNNKTSIYARLNIEALYGTDGYIANVNSINRWKNCKYDAVVSFPPIGLRLTQGDLCEAQQITPYCSCRSYEEIILYRPFHCNNAKLSVTLLPTSFCFRGGLGYELRRNLVERNLVDTIIALPSNILYGTSIPSVILVCKRGRNQDEPIKFVNADNYFLANRRKRTFDYERFVKMFEGDSRDVIKVTLNDVAKYDFDLNPLFYVSQNIDLKEGQTLAQLGDIVTIPCLKRSINGDKGFIFKVSDLSNDWSHPYIQAENLSKGSVPRGYFCLDRDAILVSLVSTLRPSIINASKDEPVWLNPNILAFTPSETIDAEYLCMKLAEMEIKTVGIGIPQNYLLRQNLVYPELPIQKDLFTESARARTLAKAEELGLKELVKQMKADYINEVRARKHDMKTPMTQLRNSLTLIKELISELPEEFACRLDKYVSRQQKAMDVLSDIVSHIADEDVFATPEIVNVEDVLKSFVVIANNYSIIYHRDETSLKEAGIDIAYLRIGKVDLVRLVQNIVSNAIKRGFVKDYENYNLNITLSVDKDFFVIDFCNNGEPFPEGMDKIRYATKGTKGVDSDGSGIGGYIVKSITQHYGGDFDIFSSKFADMNQTNIIVKLPIYRKEYE